MNYDRPGDASQRRGKPDRTVFWFVAVCAALACFVTHCSHAHAADWDNTDEALFTGLVTLQTIDALQTNEVRKHPEQFKEVNPLYGNPPNMGLVIGLKTALVAGTYYIVRDMPSRDRKLILGILDVISIGIVANNISVGVKIGF